METSARARAHDQYAEMRGELGVVGESKESFECHGLLELFGHQRIAGKMSEATIGGCAFIRIDVPAVGELPGYTRFFTQGAIYSLTPTTEEVARELAAGLRAAPIQPYDIPRLRQQEFFDNGDHGD